MFTADRCEFMNGCLVAARVIATRSISPILQMIHLSSKGHKLTITGTDQERFGITTIDIKGEADQVVCVDSGKLVQVLRESTDDIVKCSIKGNKLSVNCGRVSAELPLGQANAYPKPTQLSSGDKWMRFSRSELATMLSRASLLTGSDHNKYGVIQSAILIDDSYIGCTNGNAMCLQKHTPLDTCGGKFDPALIRKQDVSVIVQMLKQNGNTTDEATVCISGGVVVVECGGIYKMIVRQVVGKWPEYAKFLKRSYPHTIKVNAGELSTCISQGSMMTDAESIASVIGFYPDQFFVETTSPIYGTSSSNIAISAAEDVEMETMIDFSIIKPIIKSFNESDEVTIKFSDPKGFICFECDQSTLLSVPIVKS